jgi:TIR domain-containing protein
VGTVFADVDLSVVTVPSPVKHDGPSTIGIDTLFRSRGKISEVSLRGCGVPESVIVNRFALVGALEPIQFYSCFISYSTKDEDFAKRLHARMVQEKLRVWFAPEDMKAGHYHDEQIERAIQVHDKLLLVLSEASMASAWVRREIRKARETEAREDRRKLFPIRLVGMEVVQAWECVDRRTGQDYAEEVLRYHIPDFSNWKDHDSFESGFAKLLRDLKAEEATAK